MKAYGGDLQTDGISDQINGPDFDSDKWSMIHSVASRDVYMHHLYTKSRENPSRKLSLELMTEIQQSMMIEEIFSIFLDVPASKMDKCKYFDEDGACTDQFVPNDYECLRKYNEVFEKSCRKFTDQSRKYVKYFVRECEHD